MPKWLRDGEFKDDIVLSTRVRLARNVKGLPYPNRMTKQAEVNRLVSIAKETFVEHLGLRIYRLCEYQQYKKMGIAGEIFSQPSVCQAQICGVDFIAR